MYSKKFSSWCLKFSQLLIFFLQCSITCVSNMSPLRQICDFFVTGVIIVIKDFRADELSGSSGNWLSSPVRIILYPLIFSFSLALCSPDVSVLKGMLLFIVSSVFKDWLMASLCAMGWFAGRQHCETASAQFLRVPCGYPTAVFVSPPVFSSSPLPFKHQTNATLSLSLFRCHDCYC